MKKKLAISISLLPLFIILVIVVFAQPISSSRVQYHELINSLGNLMIGLGAFIAAYSFTFPLIAYLYLSEQIEDEDNWHDFVNLSIKRDGKKIAILQVMRMYNLGDRWWVSAPQLADTLYYKMDKVNLNSKSTDIKFQKYKEGFQEMSHYIANNDIDKAAGYLNMEKANGMLLNLIGIYNEICTDINKNKVPQWLRELLENKYHKKSSKIFDKL